MNAIVLHSPKIHKAFGEREPNTRHFKNFISTAIPCILHVLHRIQHTTSYRYRHHGDSTTTATYARQEPTLWYLAVLHMYYRLQERITRPWLRTTVGDERRRLDLQALHNAAFRDCHEVRLRIPSTMGRTRWYRDAH